MAIKRQWLLNLGAFSAAVVIFCFGCSADDNQPYPGQLAGSSTGTTASSAGSSAIGAGGTKTTAGGSVATINAAGKGGKKATGGKSGSAGASGKAGAAAGKSAAGAGGKAGQSGGATTKDDLCGADAKVITVNAPVGDSEYGSVDFQTAPSTGLVSLVTTLIVPEKASASSNGASLYIWPGLMPGAGTGANRGVLQPVMIWGGTGCTPSINVVDTWWIQCMYVTGMGMCSQGDHMELAIGDKIDISMTLDGTMWKQKATNRSNGKSVSFDKDMGGVPQYWALFAIEVWDVKPSGDVFFTDTVMKFAKAAPEGCNPSDMGPTDWVSPPRLSKDEKTCCVAKIILREEGVKATSPDEV